MTPKPKPDPKLKLPEQSPEDEMRERAAACGAELAKVLEKHRCRIVPFLAPPEPVGNDGSKIIVSASYGVYPDA